MEYKNNVSKKYAGYFLLIYTGISIIFAGLYYFTGIKITGQGLLICFLSTMPLNSIFIKQHNRHYTDEEKDTLTWLCFFSLFAYSIIILMILFAGLYLIDPNTAVSTINFIKQVKTPPIFYIFIIGYVAFTYAAIYFGLGLAKIQFKSSEKKDQRNSP